jgi:hypothetical protein
VLVLIEVTWCAARRRSSAPTSPDVQPVSVLIADFENRAAAEAGTALLAPTAASAGRHSPPRLLLIFGCLVLELFATAILILLSFAQVRRFAAALNAKHIARLCAICFGIRPLCSVVRHTSSPLS